LMMDLRHSAVRALRPALVERPRAGQ